MALTLKPSPPPGTDRTLLRERVLTLLQRINIDATVEEVCTPPRLLHPSLSCLHPSLHPSACTCPGTSTDAAPAHYTVAAPTSAHIRLQVLEVEPSSLMPYMQEEKTKGWQQRHADEQDDEQVRTSMRVHTVPANALSSTTALLDDRHHVLHTSTPPAPRYREPSSDGHGPDSGSSKRGRSALGRSRASSKESVERRPSASGRTTPSLDFCATGRKSPAVGNYWPSPAAAPAAEGDDPHPHPSPKP